MISRLPDEDDAVRLWDHVLGLVSFPGSAELKRSLREHPQLRGLGVGEDEVGHKRTGTAAVGGPRFEGPGLALALLG